MLRVLLLVVCFLKIYSQRLFVKYPIPYEYLITRNSANFIKDLSGILTVKDTQYYDWFCHDVDCYFAVFNSSNKLYYQPLRNLPNNGSFTDGTFGLWFRKSDYLYTLVYLNDDNPTICMRNPNYLNFTMPECPDGWLSYLRTNGMMYCYQVTDRTSRAEGILECQNMSNGANISGYQTEEERLFLHLNIFKYTDDTYVHIGAERYDGTACDKKYSANVTSLRSCYRRNFLWYENIRLSGRAERITFQSFDNIDGAPRPAAYCLQMMPFRLDDNDCVYPHPVLCGKYADNHY